MQHTLQNQDRLMVYKLPRTIARVTDHAYIPKRGDVIVFEHDDVINADYNHDISTTKQLIKRVIGIPGDRVVVKDNHVTVYNSEHPNGFNPDTTYVPTSADDSLTPGDVDIVVPKDEVFVMGDNRANSLDSRYFGPIPSKNIVGVLSLRLWPKSQKF